MYCLVSCCFCKVFMLWWFILVLASFCLLFFIICLFLAFFCFIFVYFASFLYTFCNISAFFYIFLMDLTPRFTRNGLRKGDTGRTWPRSQRKRLPSPSTNTRTPTSSKREMTFPSRFRKKYQRTTTKSTS